MSPLTLTGVPEFDLAAEIHLLQKLYEHLRAEQTARKIS